MKKIAVLVAVLSVVALVSCKKDKEKEYSVYSSRDNAKAEDLFNDIYKVVDEVASDTEGIRAAGGTCIDAITVDTSATPMLLIIDFGTDDCESSDGRIRKGIIHVTFTGRYREPGTVITYEPQNYSVDGFVVNGTKTITNLGENGLGNLEFSIEVSDAQIVAPDNAYTITWESSRIREWVEGDNSWFLIDDVYEITGSASGVNRNGIPFTAHITSPLRAEVVCPYIVSGTIEITPEDLETRIVDFGGGECNNTGTITVGGQTFTFAM
ncbi:MAG: hypothetical protein KDC12_12380 [Flavobacteriales bacterium]|nr:hypothetical protein [Flavobacteriales bacterium]